MYVIDTDVISALRRPDRAPQVAAWINGKPESELFASVITLGEIERGIQLQVRRNREFAVVLRTWLERMKIFFADRILDFGIEEARIWGHLSAKIGHNGVDLMIAATALKHEATVVTRNLNHFVPTGVPVENPFWVT